MKFIPLIGMVTILLTLLWLNNPERRGTTPPTTREVLATAIMPEIVSVPIPAIRKIRWSDGIQSTIADKKSKKTRLRYGN